jgi:hypothetical protein
MRSRTSEPKAVRIGPVGLEHHLDAHAPAQEHGRADALVAEQVQEVPGVVLDAVGTASGGARGVEAPVVPGEQAEAGGEARHQRFPHLDAAAQAAAEHQRGAFLGATGIVGETRPVAAAKPARLDDLHRAQPPGPHCTPGNGAWRRNRS